MLKGLKGRRAVVVLTDGRDEDNPGTGPGSVRTWESVLRLLQDQDVTIFPVGLGTRIDPRAPATCWRPSRAAKPTSRRTCAELAAEFQRVTENLRHRYVVGYTSTNPARDGKWRSVEIRTSSPASASAAARATSPRSGERDTRRTGSGFWISELKIAYTQMGEVFPGRVCPRNAEDR